MNDVNTKNDTINRQVALNALNKLDVSDGVGISSVACSLQEEAIRSIKNLPSAQPERIKGKWLDDCTCSICHWIHEDDNGFALITKYNFCPNCGANMRGEVKND